MEVTESKDDPMEITAKGEIKTEGNSFVSEEFGMHKHYMRLATKCETILCEEEPENLTIDSPVSTATKKGEESCVSDKLLKCSVCDYRTHNAAVLKVHTSVHLHEKPVAGSNCNIIKSYESEVKAHTGCNNLYQQIKNRTDDESYACNICNFKAPSSLSLQSHLLNHKDDRRFPCSECDYRAKRLCALQKHMKTHTGEKPFVCSSYFSGLFITKKVTQLAAINDYYCGLGGCFLENI
uniref:C2H2-type domain-containing protein n=1 Tax=Rhodnius prolixus TaxID=13249 RepID=T1HKM1_RHOPR